MEEFETETADIPVTRVSRTGFLSRANDILCAVNGRILSLLKDSNLNYFGIVESFQLFKGGFGRRLASSLILFLVVSRVGKPFSVSFSVLFEECKRLCKR